MAKTEDFSSHLAAGILVGVYRFNNEPLHITVVGAKSAPAARELLGLHWRLILPTDVSSGGIGKRGDA